MVMLRVFISSLFLLLVFAFPCFAVTIGGPADMSTPEESMFLKNQAVNNALDVYEYNMNIKSSIDLEIISERKLCSVKPDTSNVKLEGGAAMVKLSDNFADVMEVYIKVGSATFEVTWKQNSNNVKVKADSGLTWGGGVKVKVWEFHDLGIKLTLDTQYRDSDLNVDAAELNGSTSLANATNKKLEIKEWQTTLFVSKKFILPFETRDLYVIPYTGVTYTSLDVDAKFTSTSAILYSTYNTSDKEPVGIVIGCDIIPSLLDWYLWSFELRLRNETAFSLGGTVRF